MNLVPVRVRGCECPGAPHPDGDVVFMLPTLSLEGGLAAEHDNSLALGETLAAAGNPPFSEAQQQLMARDMTERLRRKWLVTYVRYGAVAWNFEDEQGPVPFDVEAIVADYGMGQPVAEMGDKLYGETVTRPLLSRQETRSPRGRTDLSTSRKTSTRTPRRRSSPASMAASGRSAR